MGNLLEKFDVKNNVSLATYTYDAADKITNTDYSYDNDGSLTQERRYDDNSLWAYTHGGHGKMAGATDGTNVYQFDYDGDGNRVRQTVNSVVTEYLVDRTGGLPEVVAEINSGGNLKVFYVRGLELISQERNGTVRYYGHDGLGSTILLTDLSGLPTDHYRYDAWGNVVATDGVTPNTFRYTGQQQDSTRLYYLRARYYGPQQSRFVSRDPLPGAGAEPLSLHLYVYARANAANLTDASGTQTSLGLLVCISIGAILGALTYAYVVSRDPFREPRLDEYLHYVAGGVLIACLVWFAYLLVLAGAAAVAGGATVTAVSTETGQTVVTRVSPSLVDRWTSRANFAYHYFTKEFLVQRPSGAWERGRGHAADYAKELNMAEEMPAETYARLSYVTTQVGRRYVSKQGQFVYTLDLRSLGATLQRWAFVVTRRSGEIITSYPGDAREFERQTGQVAPP